MKHKFTLFAALSAFCGICGAENLIYNSSFELENAGWSEHVYHKSNRPDGSYRSAVSYPAGDAVSADREYVITIEELGLYNITYYAETDSPNARAKDETVAYSLNILDTVCPEIRFADEGKTLTAKPGEKIVFDGLSVTDNDTAAEDIEILYFVLTPNGSVVMPGSNEFSAERAGLYTVYIKAADSYGNSDIVYCYLEIK